MKLKNKSKQKKEFNPVGHWHAFLMVMLVVLVLIILYSIYSFVFIKNEIAEIDIEAKNGAQNSTSTEAVEKSRNTNKFLKDINNLNKILEEYNAREDAYKELRDKPVFVPQATVVSSSSTVATSTE